MSAAAELAALDYRMTPEDAALARMVALAREGGNLAAGRPDAYGASGALALHIDGARAELAFGRMLGCPLDRCWSWYTNGDLAELAPDVAGWQVRSTRHQRGHLIIHPRDNPADRFALVITNGMTYRAAGWMIAADAHRPEWWRQLNAGQAAAWCVPQDRLRPFAAGRRAYSKV